LDFSLSLSKGTDHSAFGSSVQASDLMASCRSGAGGVHDRHSVDFLRHVRGQRAREEAGNHAIRLVAGFARLQQNEPERDPIVAQDSVRSWVDLNIIKQLEPCEKLLMELARSPPIARSAASWRTSRRCRARARPDSCPAAGAGVG
jgi:hypothetical protein